MDTEVVMSLDGHQGCNAQHKIAAKGRRSTKRARPIIGSSHGEQEVNEMSRGGISAVSVISGG